MRHSDGIARDTSDTTGLLRGAALAVLLSVSVAGPATAQETARLNSGTAVSHLAVSPLTDVEAVDPVEPTFPLFSPALTQALIRTPELRGSLNQAEPELKWYQTESFKRTIAPASLITAGLLAYGDGGLLDREAIREWRNTFIPDYEDHFDDYGQFLAGFLALGLNAAGVPGKHNLLRASGTYALSLSLMFVTIHTGKELMAVRRPDDSSNNAFPSGHTAASFASARFLDREYGHVSYLYSLGGYSLATITGVMRQLNNRHWLSDVLVGAGVGLLSTDIAYILMDEFFGDKGKVPLRPGRPAGRERGNPSFLDFRLGYAQQVGDLDDQNAEFFAEQGWTAGFEGAYFFNTYFGLGGEVSVAGFPINDEKFIPESDTIVTVAEEIVTQPFGAEWIYAGPFFFLPLGDRWSLGGKLTAGVNQGATGTISVKIKEEFQEAIGAKEIPVRQFDPTATFGFAANAAVRFMVSERIGIRLFGEYNYSSPDYLIKEVTGVAEDGTLEIGQILERENVDFSFVSFGASVSAMLW